MAITEPGQVQDGDLFNNLSESLKDEISDILYANDQTLDGLITALTSVVNGIERTYVDNTVPAAANLNDLWIDGSSNNQIKYCNTAYTVADGLSEAQKLTKWTDIHDNEAKAAADAAASTANTATQTVISATPPDGFTENWIWVHSGENNQPYICTATYAAGLPEATRLTKFQKIEDNDARLLAAAAQGLADGKTETFFQNDVPASADGADRWVDTNETDPYYRTQVCSDYYLTHDGSTWDSSTVYYNETISDWDSASTYTVVAGSSYPVVRYNKRLYAAVSTNSNSRPPSADWLDIGVSTGEASVASEVQYGGTIYTAINSTLNDAPPSANWTTGGAAYPTQTDYRADQWEDIADKVAQDLAAAVETIADGKVVTFIISPGTTPPVGTDYPAAAQIGDLLVDFTDDKQVYYCKETYTASTPAVSRPGKWEKTTDPAAQARADLAKDQADRKTITYFQTDVPNGTENLVDGYIEVGDSWIDTDDDNASRVCGLKYKSAGSYQDATHANTDGELYSGGTSYVSGDIVRSAGVAYQANTAVSGVAPPAAQWNSLGATAATTTDEWRLEQFSAMEDENSRALADEAKGIADNKRQTFYQATIPDPGVVGAIDVGDGWFNSGNNELRLSNIAQNPGDGTSLSRWDLAQDAATVAIATAAASAVDNKRTTFYTQVTDAQTQTQWPGPGGGSQIAISYWDDLIDENGDLVGAKEGDLWVNDDSGTRRTQICVDPYNGYAGGGGDIGSNAHWTDFALDAGIVSALANYLPLAGGLMSGNITHAATQDFSGADALFSGNGEVRYGGSQAVPGVPSVAAGIVNKKYADDTFLKLAGGTMSGPIAMGSSKITGLAAGSTAGDAIRYEQLNYASLTDGAGTLSGNGNKFLQINAGGTAVAYVTESAIDHGGLSGKGDDDHTQYVIVGGTRAVTGQQTTIIRSTDNNNYLRLEGAADTAIVVDATSGNAARFVLESGASFAQFKYLHSNGYFEFDKPIKYIGAGPYGIDGGAQRLISIADPTVDTDAMNLQYFKANKGPVASGSESQPDNDGNVYADVPATNIGDTDYRAMVNFSGYAGADYYVVGSAVRAKDSTHYDMSMTVINIGSGTNQNVGDSQGSSSLTVSAGGSSYTVSIANQSTSVARVNFSTTAGSVDIGIAATGCAF